MHHSHAVIAAATATLGQLAQIWPEKTDAQRRQMLGVTPMIGRNFTSRILQSENATSSWRGRTRPASACSRSGRSAATTVWLPGRRRIAHHSSITQPTFQFTKIFKGFS